MKSNYNQSMYEEIGTYCKNLGITSCSEKSQECTAKFQFPRGFVGFRGHFPGKPVMPAIGQLALIRFISEEAVKKNLIPKEYNKTKFTGIVQPEEELCVKIKLNQYETFWLAQFQILQSDDSKISSGEITFSI